MVAEIFTRQLDGCTYCSGGLNCTCACHSMWLYRASQGRIVHTSCTIRRMTRDTVGGTNLRQMDTIARAQGISTGKLYLPATFDLVAGLIETGRYGAHINISYNRIAGTQYDCFHGAFRGNHDWYVSAPAPGDFWRVGDPGADGRQRGSWHAPDGYQMIPVELIRLAAGDLDLGGHPLGRGKVYAYVTPPDPVVSGHFGAVVTHPTSLWNDSTKRWVYNGPNRIPVGRKLEVRGIQVRKGGVACYPVTSGAYATFGAGYYVPVANVKLGGHV